MRHASKLDKARDEFIPAITALAEKFCPSKLSEKQREEGGFLIPYTESEYRYFAKHAEHFYVLIVGSQVVGFLLAHSSETIQLFGGEVYLHISKVLKRPFIVVRQICIAPEFSNMKNVKALYDFLVQQLKKSMVCYETMVGFSWKQPYNNPRSEKIHEKLGWKELEIYTLKNSEGVVAIGTNLIG